MQRRDVLKTAVAAVATCDAIDAQSEAASPAVRLPLPGPKKPAARHYAIAPDGTNLYWREWGRGPAILFLSGAALPTEMWNYQMTAFADAGFRCIAYDRRGHGRSEVPAHGYDYDTLADDLDAVIEALDLRDLTLVSHSMAGGEAVRYLTRHGGSRIARNVMLAPTTPFLLKTSDNPHGISEGVFEALRSGWKKDYPKWVAENTDAFFVPETSPAMKAWVAGLITRIAVPVAIACNQALTTTDFRAEMQAMHTPTLIIHGDLDVSAPLSLTGQPSAALIPGNVFKVYEGAPHGLMYTHSERLHADILSFIRGRNG